MNLPYWAIRIASGAENKKSSAEFAFDPEHIGIIWLTQGVAAAFLDLAPSTMSAGTIICILPGTLLRCHFEKDARGWAAALHRDLLAPIEPEMGTQKDLEVFSHLGGRVLSTDEEFFAKTTPVFEALLRMQEDNQQVASAFISGYVRVLLRQIHRLSDRINSPSNPFFSSHHSILMQFNRLLEAHFRHQHRTAFYAKEIGLSTGYLNEVLKKTSGKPAKTLILDRLFLEARRKASQRGVSLQEAAYDLGFHDPAHFSRFFKQQSGLTFLQFRQKTQKA